MGNEKKKFDLFQTVHEWSIDCPLQTINILYGSESWWVQPKFTS
jgi:hypothetical protein